MAVALSLSARQHRLLGRGRDSGPTGQPPDLDELWRDLNRKLGGLFGNKNGGSRVLAGAMEVGFNQT